MRFLWTTTVQKYCCVLIVTCLIYLPTKSHILIYSATHSHIKFLDCSGPQKSHIFFHKHSSLIFSFTNTHFESHNSCDKFWTVVDHKKLIFSSKKIHFSNHKISYRLLRTIIHSLSQKISYSKPHNVI